MNFGHYREPITSAREAAEALFAPKPEDERQPFSDPGEPVAARKPVSTPERNYIGGRSKNTSQAEMEGWFSSVTSKLSFPVRSMSLLSRPDRLPRATARSVGDGRSGATRSTASMASTGPSPQ